MFDSILVPQGAEAAAVRQGLKRALKQSPKQDSKQAQASPAVLAIAMGPEATASRLATALDSGNLAPGSRVLVLGVAGSLSPRLSVGDAVIYECFTEQSTESNPTTEQIQTMQEYSAELQSRLPTARLVTALSSDRLIHSAQEKAQLQTSTGAEAVDMEAAAIQRALAPQGCQISTVRVISDARDMDLPNIEGVIAPNGELNGLKMAMAMVRQPKASINLIQGSLQALKVLETVTYKIFSKP